MPSLSGGWGAGGNLYHGSSHGPIVTFSSHLLPPRPHRYYVAPRLGGQRHHVGPPRRLHPEACKCSALHWPIDAGLGRHHHVGICLRGAVLPETPGFSYTTRLHRYPHACDIPLPDRNHRDLNTALTNWDSQGCTGTITFTAADKYLLSNEYSLTSGTDWTFNGVPGVVLQAKASSRHFDAATGTKLTFKQLTILGNGMVGRPTTPETCVRRNKCTLGGIQSLYRPLKEMFEADA